MKLEHIVGLAVRLFSITLALYALRNAISFFPYFYDQAWRTEAYAYLALMVFFLFLALFLWHFPLTIAKRLITFKDSGEDCVDSVTADQLQIVGFTTLGIYLLFNVLSDVVYWLSILFISNRNKSVTTELSPDQLSNMVSTGIELIFVLFLLLGTTGITHLLRKLRYGKDS